MIDNRQSAAVQSATQMQESWALEVVMDFPKKAPVTFSDVGTEELEGFMNALYYLINAHWQRSGELLDEFQMMERVRAAA